MNFNDQNGYQKYNDSDFNSKSSSNSISNIEYGKTIRLLRNGDPFYKGQKFVVNSRKYRYFDVLMDDISNSLSSNFGAIRKIHTPTNGHRITSLEQLEDGKTYVAAGNNKFIKLNYHVISEGKRLPPSRLPAINRVDYNSTHVPQYEEPQNATIYIYRNGDTTTPAYKLLLYKSTMSSLDAVLNEIAQKIKLQTGAVTKLYTIDGDQIVSSNQIVSGKVYVVGNREQKFKRVKYLNYEELFTSPKLVKKAFKELPPVKTSLSQEFENGIYSFSNGNKNSNNLTNNNYKLNVIPRKKSEDLDDNNEYIDPNKRNKLTGRTNHSSNSELNGTHHLSNNNISNNKNINNSNHNSNNNNNHNLTYQEQEENEEEENNYV